MTDHTPAARAPGGTAGSRTLGECAARVRTKNAGPFWLTIDVFCATDSDYDRVAQSGALTAEVIGQLYRADPATVLLFHLPELRVIKASFPRPVVQGSFADRDMHSGQQHIPLAALNIPTPTSSTTPTIATTAHLGAPDEAGLPQARPVSTQR